VLAATEAVPRLAVGRDDEGRRLLGVKRAKALVNAPRTFERDRLADDVDDGELRLDLGNDAGRGGDAADLSRERSRMCQCVKGFVKPSRAILPQSQVSVHRMASRNGVAAAR
jgi:hypothetical protein